MNNLTKKEYEFEVYDANRSNLFYTLTLSLPENVDDGEYSYWLMDWLDGSEDLTVLATGLCIVGDYVPTKQVYENKNTYIQYK